MAVKAGAHGCGQKGKVLLEARHDWQSDFLGGVQKRSGGVRPIAYNIVGEARAQVPDRAPQQTLGGGILAIARPVGFHVDRQRQPNAHHADQYKMVQRTMHLAFGIFDRITQRARLFVRRPRRYRPEPDR